MGVKSLWTLLAPAGRPVMLETAEGKSMAIDSSIWIYQFQATMRDKEGRALNNAHVLGFLRRISKLLFYGIKPVFVFDGGAPALKRNTLNERRKKKSGAAASHHKLAEKLLAAQLRREALNHTQTPKKAKQTRQIELNDDTVYLEDLEGGAPRTPAKKKVATPSSSAKKNKFRDSDPYSLPSVNMDEVISQASQSAAPDPRLATEDELRSFIEDMRPGDFDIYSPAFRELPTEVQYEIIGDLRLKSRQTSYDRLHKMLKNARTPMDFSKQQILNLKQRNTLTQQLLMTTDSIGSAHIAIPVRIASERNREYILMKNEGEEGGWILGIKDIGTKEKPIVLDHDESKAEIDDESDSDMEEVEVPVSAPADPDLREYQREMALTGVSKRNTDKGLLPLSTKGINRKGNSTALLEVLQTDAAVTVEPASQTLESDSEDDNLVAYAIQASLDQTPLPQAGPSSTPTQAPRSTKPVASVEEDDDFYVNFSPPGSRLQTALSMANSNSSVNRTPSKPAAGSTFGKPTLLTSPRPPSPSPRNATLSPVSISQTTVDKTFPARTTSTFSAPTSFGKPMLLSSPKTVPTSVHSDNRETELQSPFKPVPYPAENLSSDDEEMEEVIPAVPQNQEASNGSPVESVQPDVSSSVKAYASSKSRIIQEEHDVPRVSTPLQTDPVNASTYSESDGEIDKIPAPVKTPPQLLVGESGLDFTPKSTVSVHSEPTAKLFNTVVEVTRTIPHEHPYTPPRDTFEGGSTTEPLFSFSRSPSPSEDIHDVLGHADDWDAAQEMDPHAEDGEFAQFMSQVKGRNVEDARKEIDEEIRTLNRQRKAAIRDSEDITQQMISQIMTMLRLFGIPYITAPMEAEAQCAELVSLRLVDGVITDDSDVFLFGAHRVYKNMFNQSKTVECFVSTDLSRELGLDRDTLIQLAYLLGSDYTEGLPGVGPVVAMELLKEFPGRDGLFKFKDWWMKVQSGRDREQDSNTKFRRQFKKRFKNLYLPDDWPNSVVRDAYYHPTVDSSEEPFKWGMPDLDGLRVFFHTELGWRKSKVDELLLPIIQKMNKRNQAAALNRQGNLDEFLDVSSGAGTYAPRQRQVYASNRLQEVISDFRKRQRGGSTTPHSKPALDNEGDQTDSGSGSEQGPPAKRARKKARPATTTQKDKSKGKAKAKADATTSKTRGTSKGARTRRGKGKSKETLTSDDDEHHSEEEDEYTPVVEGTKALDLHRTEELNLRPRPRPRPRTKAAANVNNSTVGKESTGTDVQLQKL